MFARIFSGLLRKAFVGGKLSVMEIQPTPPGRRHSPWSSFRIRVISVIRGQNFGCGRAALGHPRAKSAEKFLGAIEETFVERRVFIAAKSGEFFELLALLIVQTARHLD